MQFSNKSLIPFLILVVLIVITFGAISFKGAVNTISTMAAPPATPTPTPTIFTPGPVKVETMDSPDGTRQLTMQRQKFQDYVTYSFYDSAASDSQKKQFFTKNVKLTDRLSIPYNTWSPDNTYVFLKESTSSQENYYVFFVSGEKFSDGSSYLDIQKLFSEKVDGYTITDVTGWADPVLLLVNTESNDEKTKVSFWFDVTSQSFIKLSTYFR